MRGVRLQVSASLTQQGLHLGRTQGVLAGRPPALLQRLVQATYHHCIRLCLVQDGQLVHHCPTARSFYQVPQPHGCRQGEGASQHPYCDGAGNQAHAHTMDDARLILVDFPIQGLLCICKAPTQYLPEQGTHEEHREPHDDVEEAVPAPNRRRKSKTQYHGQSFPEHDHPSLRRWCTAVGDAPS